MGKEQQPKEHCEIDPKCEGKPEWWLVDQKEIGQYKACDEHKRQYTGDRFQAEHRKLPMVSSREILLSSLVSRLSGCQSELSTELSTSDHGNGGQGSGCTDSAVTLRKVADNG